jgi:hypothetical protein
VTVLPALGSTYPAAKQALLTLLLARPNLAGVSITWSNPGGSVPDEFIVLNEAQGTVTSAAIGSQRREERWTMAVVISVLNSTDDQAMPTLRAFVLRDEIAAQIRSDATLGGVVRWALDAGWEVAERTNGTRSETQVTMHIDMAARI